MISHLRLEDLKSEIKGSCTNSTTLAFSWIIGFIKRENCIASQKRINKETNGPCTHCGYGTLLHHYSQMQIEDNSQTEVSLLNCGQQKSQRNN